jgi:integrase
MPSRAIASVQKTVLVLFEEIMQEFHSRVGIDRVETSYQKYVSTYRHLQRFLKAKYNLRDIPLSQLDLPFIESFDFYLRIERKMKTASVNGVIIQLLSAARTALHRNYISRPPFFGYRLERPDFQIRSLAAGELDSLISTKIEFSDLCYIRDMFVFACFTGISYIDLKNLTWKEIITEAFGFPSLGKRQVFRLMSNCWMFQSKSLKNTGIFHLGSRLSTQRHIIFL